MSFSFRRTQFRASSSRKSLGREQKRGMKGETGTGGGGAVEETLAHKTHHFEKLRLPTNATSDCCGTVSDQYINQQ